MLRPHSWLVSDYTIPDDLFFEDKDLALLEDDGEEKDN